MNNWNENRVYARPLPQERENYSRPRVESGDSNCRTVFRESQNVCRPFSRPGGEGQDERHD